MIEETRLFPTKVFNTHLKYFTPDYEKVILKCMDDLNTKEKWKNNDILYQTYDSDLHKKYEYKILVDFFHKALDEIKKHFEYDTEKFTVNLMWANKTYKDGHHNTHYHPNSFYSGIFYLSSGSPTYFIDPNILKVSSALSVKSKEENETSFIGEPGVLLIFPSWLYHGTFSNNTEERMTISFNSLPTGKTNYKREEHLFSRMNIQHL